MINLLQLICNALNKTTRLQSFILNDNLSYENAIRKVLKRGCIYFENKKQAKTCSCD